MKGRNKQKWLTISLVNLSVVALLGFILRSKILFSIPIVDFKNVLHAHSHFAFGGWVSLAIITLLVYEILPKADSNKPIYQWIFGCITLNAWGMLISFVWQGYALFSILFSTLFILTTYAFAWVFIRDVRKSVASNAVKLLSIASCVYMVLSSVGPYTLAYLMASKSGNVILYKDAVYTYLHLQYNGFFTLGVFALLFNRIENIFTRKGLENMRRFARFLNISIIPSLFLCYLWHYPNNIFRIIAVTGSVTMLVAVGYFIAMILLFKSNINRVSKATFYIATLSMVAFVFKMILQSLTIFEEIGAAVFSNRPVIIGFLHLVLLAFITLYLLSHFVHAGIISNSKLSSTGLIIFTSSVVFNEILLMSQGLGIMLMESSNLFPWLLWVAAIGLFISCLLLIMVRFEIGKSKKEPVYQELSPEFKMLFTKNK